MLKHNQFWILTAAGAVAIGLTLTNMYFYLGNRALQLQLNERAQYIQQSVALDGLYREIVQALADRAVRTQDTQIRDMLAGEGINVDITGTAPSGNQPGVKP